MFIYKPKSSKQVQKKLDLIKEKFHILPPHWELLASIAPKRFDMFIQEIEYLLTHPNINPDFFAMLRLYIANKENFSYCRSLNTRLLLARSYDKNIIQEFKEDIKTIPLDQRHKLLAQKAIKAMYYPKEFTAKDIKELKDISWSDSDIYDAIDHAGFLFKFSKILKVYLA